MLMLISLTAPDLMCAKRADSCSLLLSMPFVAHCRGWYVAAFSVIPTARNSEPLHRTQLEAVPNDSCLVLAGEPEVRRYLGWKMVRQKSRLRLGWSANHFSAAPRREGSRGRPLMPTDETLEAQNLQICQFLSPLPPILNPAPAYYHNRNGTHHSTSESVSSGSILEWELLLPPNLMTTRPGWLIHTTYTARRGTKQ